jgi:DNA modification methylase
MDNQSLKDKLNKMKKHSGFPLGNEKDMLEISSPPNYTAYPNPYLNEFIEKNGTKYNFQNDSYNKKPFVGDVSEGKTSKVYRAHSYHTKVPHKAIKKFIKHYTEKGDIVFDGFCGSGMTGVAAQQTKRKGIISDLSPAATFIAKNYNMRMNPIDFKNKSKKILKEVEKETNWMYETYHDPDPVYGGKEEESLFDKKNEKGKINYTVWSDVLLCPYCGEEYTFWDLGVIKETGKLRDEFKCENCNAKITKNESERKIIKFFDQGLGKEIEQAKQVPVVINYTYKGNRYNKNPDKFDLELIEKIKNVEIPYEYPTNELPDGYNTEQPKNSHGVTNVHHFYFKRALYTLSAYNDRLDKNNKILLTAILPRASRMHKWKKGQTTGIVTGTLYIPSLVYEYNINKMFRERPRYTTGLCLPELNNDTYVSTNSIEDIPINSNSIDYIFTDPPFGDNLMYSELNFIWESWLKVFTNNETEAIVNSSQNKNLDDYTSLMTQGFKEMYRILKPNRWMTVVFHNSKAKVWNAIQESITRAGFIIAQVSTLDKKQGSFKQVTSAGAVKNDLVINAYKPKKEFEDKFLKNAGEGLEADFVKEQLKHLPVEANIERTEQMLYSKMLAHYVENGFKIKYDANNFYKLLHDNFVELDGYWFLEDQADEYSEWKSSLKLDEIEDIKKGNQVLFVVDEKSALTWINNFLDEPKEYGEIYTSYEQIATQTDDKIPELRELLDQNFILEDGKYRRPKTRKERESIEKSRTKNLERAWKKLLDRAKNGSRKIKNIRKEALIYGFTKCYQQENYEDIVTVADRLYKSTLESSGDILDFVDIARMKTE